MCSKCLLNLNCLLHVCCSEYRSTMKKLVHNITLLMPRTAAKEALEVVQKLIPQQPKSGMCMRDMVGFAYIVKESLQNSVFENHPMVFEIRETEPHIQVFIQLFVVQYKIWDCHPFCVGESEETESECLFIYVSSHSYCTQQQLSCLQCTTATSTCHDIYTTPVPQALTSR